MNEGQREDLDLESSLRKMTADVVSAYVSNNPIQSTDLSKVIVDVHRTFSSLGQKNRVSDEAPDVAPAVNPRRSVKPDQLVCLECGLTFKSLKRHLRVAHGLSPDEYKAKWKLGADYPMVAPEYAAKRSALAKSFDLGRKGR